HRWTCPKGHQYETALDEGGPSAATVCPVCVSQDAWIPPPPTSLPAPIPQAEGFEILSELGRGGMGVVYKASHHKLDRVVALKLIANSALAGPRERQRFREAARVAAGLNHPNIVAVYEVGEQGGVPYFALEYVEGSSLDRQIAGKPQPAGPSASLVQTL